MGYAMNKTLSGIKLEKVDEPANTVLFFESDNGTTVTLKRHSQSPHFTFADGHTKRIVEKSQKNLVWTTSLDLTK
jgi:prepilin-type processing-associated H-X9-DG protein